MAERIMGAGLLDGERVAIFAARSVEDFASSCRPRDIIAEVEQVIQLGEIAYRLPVPGADLAAPQATYAIRRPAAVTYRVVRRFRVSRGRKLVAL